MVQDDLAGELASQGAKIVCDSDTIMPQSPASKAVEVNSSTPMPPPHSAALSATAPAPSAPMSPPSAPLSESREEGEEGAAMSGAAMSAASSVQSAAGAPPLSDDGADGESSFTIHGGNMGTDDDDEARHVMGTHDDDAARHVATHDAARVVDQDEQSIEASAPPATPPASVTKTHDTNTHDNA
jgi:hypothetical protein